MIIDDKHRFTVIMALTSWKYRCYSEATIMRKWAIEMPDKAEKCEANAKASESLAREAQAALDAM